MHAGAIATNVDAFDPQRIEAGPSSVEFQADRAGLHRAQAENEPIDTESGSTTNFVGPVAEIVDHLNAHVRSRLAKCPAKRRYIEAIAEIR